MKQITPHIAKRLVPAIGLIAALGLLISPLLILPAIVLGVSLLRPRTVGMPILTLLIPVQFFVSTFGLTFSFVDVLILLLAMVLLFQTLILRKQFCWGPLWLPFLVFGTALAIAAARSNDFAQAIITVMRLSSYGLVYLLVLNLTESQADARRILISMFIAGTGVAILGIGQSILGVSFTHQFLASRLGQVLVRESQLVRDVSGDAAGSSLALADEATGGCALALDEKHYTAMGGGLCSGPVPRRNRCPCVCHYRLFHPAGHRQVYCSSGACCYPGLVHISNGCRNGRTYRALGLAECGLARHHRVFKDEFVARRLQSNGDLAVDRRGTG